MTYKSLTFKLRYVYSPHSRWGMAGEIYPCWNSDGTKKWPWLTRGIQDWDSPNGIVLNYHTRGLGLFPDEQPCFLDDMGKNDEEDEEYSDKEDEEYLDKEEEMEVEADVNVEMETEDEKQPRKVKGVKGEIVKTKTRKTMAKGGGKGKGKAKKGKM
jgi:hypothetical protein